MAMLLRKELVNKIAASRKYRSLYRPTIERVVSDCLTKYPEREAEKKARNLLHQVWGIFYPIRPDFKKLLEKFKETIKNGGGPTSSVLPILRLHASTKERAEILYDFYQKVFAVTGPPKSVIDWACGLNPLSWPWMELPENCPYLGLDIDKEQNDFLNGVFKIAGKNNFRAELGDIFIDKLPRADIVFLLKLLPLLEHQKKGSGLEILERQDAKWLVVSFPTKSVSGKSKGMIDFYSKQFQDLIKEAGWETTKIMFPTELVFVIKNHGNHSSGR